MIEVKLQGVEAVNARLLKLPERLQRNAIAAAVRKVLSPMARAAKANAPVDLGLLRKSIGSVVRKYKGGGIVWGGIGARSGFKARLGIKSRGENKGKPVYSNPTQYAHLVERGTSHSKAKPFLRPAFDAHQGKALDTFAAVLDKAIDREVAKLARQGGKR